MTSANPNPDSESGTIDRAVAGETFTLHQAVASVAFGDPNQDLNYELPLRGDDSRWPGIFKREDAIQHAVHLLEEAINCGKIPIRGWRMLEGIKQSNQTENHNPIPTGTLALGCLIPFEFLLHDGGRLVFVKGETDRGGVDAIYYRNVHLLKSAVAYIAKPRTRGPVKARPGQKQVDEFILQFMQKGFESGVKKSEAQAREATKERFAGGKIEPSDQQFRSAFQKVPQEHKCARGEHQQSRHATGRGARSG